MREIQISELPYHCRTKDLLWFSETRQVVDMMIKEDRSFEDIKKLADQENLFNAASASRAKDIRQAIGRRITAVDNDFLQVFVQQNTTMQKILCLTMLMLTDRTFYEFMDHIFREKLISGNDILKDSDLFGFLHSIQAKDPKAAKWTDVGMRKARTNYKQILKDAGLTTDELNDRKLLKPILSKPVDDLFRTSGLEPVRKILTGKR